MATPKLIRKIVYIDVWNCKMSKPAASTTNIATMCKPAAASVFCCCFVWDALSILLLLLPVFS